MENFFEEKALQLMKQMSEEDFLRILTVELQRCFQHMSIGEKKEVERLLNKILQPEDNKIKVSNYFIDNFYKATVGRNVSIISQKFIIEGKIKDVDDEKKTFDMIIKKSTNNKKVGGKITISANMFQDNLQFCAFE